MSTLKRNRQYYKQKPSKMDAEEIKDTIVVRGSGTPEPEVDEDEAAGSKTTQDSLTVATTATSTAPHLRPQAKGDPLRTCAFCKPFIGPNTYCIHVRKSSKSVQRGRRSVVRAKGSITVVVSD